MPSQVQQQISVHSTQIHASQLCSSYFKWGNDLEIRQDFLQGQMCLLLSRSHQHRSTTADNH